MNKTKKKASQKKSMRRKALRNMLIVMIALLVIVYSFELALAVVMPSTSNVEVNSLIFNYEKSSVDDLSSTMMTRNMFDLSEPGPVKSVYPLIDLSYDNEYDDNTVNIVVIGDSFVWGHGSLNRNELFWSLLEKQLRQKGYNCRVYGVGMAGANAFEEYDWLTRSSLVADLDPDIVIFGYVTNDWLAGERGYDLSSITRSSFFFSLVSKLTPKTFSILYQLPTGKILKDAENNFVAPLNEYAKNADFPIVYMTLPIKAGFLKSFYRPLHKLFSKYTNVAFYDPLHEFTHDFMSKEHSENYKVNPSDSHPGSATNRFYADYITDFLEKDYPDVLGKIAGKDLNNYSIQINEYMPYRLNLQETDRSADSVAYTLDYPSENHNYSFKTPTRDFSFDKYLLNYPLGEDYIKLSFSQPVDVKSIEITGDKVENIDLYCTLLNEKLGYDDHKIIPFGTKSADGQTWTDSSSEKVMSLCIHADCVNKDGSKLQAKIYS